MNKFFWKNKKVLVTGHTGFKGGWLTLVLLSLGANVSGLSLKENKKSLFISAAKKENLIKLEACVNFDLENSS